MGIIYCEKDRTFTLQTKETTYQMQVDQYGFLLHLYYGKKAEGCMDYLLTYYDRGFSGNPYDAGTDRTYSMDSLPQELSCYGNGDFRSASLMLENGDGSMSCDMRYKNYTIRDGKYSLPGLPAVYADNDEAQTLEIVLEDPATGVEAMLLYGVLPELDIITRSVYIRNQSSEKIYVNKVMSAELDFLYGDYDLLTFYGRHAMERNLQRVPVAHGSQMIGSVRGTSSHQYNPMMILAEKDTTEDHGGCYAMSFVYSGNFQGEVLKDQYNQTRMLLGVQEECFRYPLEAGETFYAPEVILSYTDQGMNRLSQNLHSCIRHHICRGKYKTEVRPVLVNSWEAAYFDFTGRNPFECEVYFEAEFDKSYAEAELQKKESVLSMNNTLLNEIHSKMDQLKANIDQLESATKISTLNNLFEESNNLLVRLFDLNYNRIKKHNLSFQEDTNENN